MTTNRLTTLTVGFFLITSFSYQSGLSLEQSSKHFNTTDDGVMLGGYDLVSFFVSDEPTLGSESIQYELHGITYRFSSEENRSQFTASPEKYVPQYGGWCATGMAFELIDSRWPSGKYKVDPSNYLITNEKLYLFYDFDGYNAKPDWERANENLESKASEVWEAMIKN